MAVSQDRFTLALARLTAADWERFERLASTFLASEWPTIRTMASPNGDGGRDAELFSPTDTPNVAIQYSIQTDWKSKIRGTIKRLKETFPQTTILVFMSNEKIGASADELKKKAGIAGVFLDIRDQSWFIERVNLDDSRVSSAAELCRLIVDPLLESSGAFPSTASGLSRDEAKIAFLFLEMQWRNETDNKGLTKSSFEALVRAALNGTSSAHRLKRSEIHARVAKFLPQHSEDRLAPFVDGALRRLTKKVIGHWPQSDEFNLTHQEGERLKEVAIGIQLLNDAFEKDIIDIVETANLDRSRNAHDIISTIKSIITHYFLRQGENFAAALHREIAPLIHDSDLNNVIIEWAPRQRLSTSRDNISLLKHIIRSLLTDPSSSTKEYLLLLSNAYTLFAFLEETPDVKRVTDKIFGQAIVWLDTTVLLPVIAEQAYPEEMRPFTAMFRQAKAAKIHLLVTRGIVEEIERHLNKCLTYTRSLTWEGNVPYIYTQYILSGREPRKFMTWTEEFCGTTRPDEDISEYLSSEFNIKLVDPDFRKIDPAIAAAVTEFWSQVHNRRRRESEGFSLHSARLAQHDSEVCLSVLNQRREEVEKSPLGYTSWWLTLDRAAREMETQLDRGIWREIRNSPVLSIDFLLKYISFGPRRGKTYLGSGSAAAIFTTPLFESLPQDLLSVAQGVRNEYGTLSERLIQRRIRDALDRERMRSGFVERVGLEGAHGAIKEAFE